MSEAELNKRKREIFARVGVRSLKQWLQEDEQAESIYDLIGNDENVNRANLPGNPNNFGGMKKMGSYSDCGTDKRVDNSQDLGKYLLLDLRGKDEYLKFHIKEAISFPNVLINQDRFIPEIYKYSLYYILKYRGI